MMRRAAHVVVEVQGDLRRLRRVTCDTAGKYSREATERRVGCSALSFILWVMGTLVLLLSVSASCCYSGPSQFGLGRLCLHLWRGPIRWVGGRSALIRLAYYTSGLWFMCMCVVEPFTSPLRSSPDVKEQKRTWAVTDKTKGAGRYGIQWSSPGCLHSGLRLVQRRQASSWKVLARWAEKDTNLTALWKNSPLHKGWLMNTVIVFCFIKSAQYSWRTGFHQLITLILIWGHT